jgi:hypothetical protein
MTARKPSLQELRVEARRAFGRGTTVSRTRVMTSGEHLVVRSDRGSDCCTLLTVQHSWRTDLARNRLLAMLRVFGDRRTSELGAGRCYSWSSP